MLIRFLLASTTYSTPGSSRRRPSWSGHRGDGRRDPPADAAGAFNASLVALAVVSFIFVYLLQLIRIVNTPLAREGATQDDVSLFLVAETLEHIREDADPKPAARCQPPAIAGSSTIPSRSVTERRQALEVADVGVVQEDVDEAVDLAVRPEQLRGEARVGRDQVVDDLLDGRAVDVDELRAGRCGAERRVGSGRGSSRPSSHDSNAARLGASTGARPGSPGRPRPRPTAPARRRAAGPPASSARCP